MQLSIIPKTPPFGGGGAYSFAGDIVREFYTPLKEQYPFFIWMFEYYLL